MASMAYGRGVDLYYWGRGISVHRSLCDATYFAVRTLPKTLYPFVFSEYQQDIRFAHLSVELRPTLERAGRIFWSHVPIFAYRRLY
eukprot:6204139-Pleurochrysis_carterae.AAC.2